MEEIRDGFLVKGNDVKEPGHVMSREKKAMQAEGIARKKAPRW